MVIRIPQRSERIHAVVIFFSIFVALMLFQTSYMRLGTITAAGAIFLTIAAFFFRGGTFNSQLRLPVPALSLLLFLVYSVVRTLATGKTPSNFLPYVSQIILCLILFSVSLNKEENRFLKTVFAVASLVYAVLIIKSLNENQLEGYYHSKVQIFNTEFDPNFIGIPLTAAMALLLDRILREKRKILSAAMYIVIAYAVIYTASRGSLVAALVSSGLVLVLFLLRAKISVWKKALYLVLPVLAIIMITVIVKEMLPVEWERLTQGSEADDNGNGRLLLWEIAIEDWMNKPIFGNGLGYAYETHGKASHNTYLQILSETGLIGAILLGGFLVPLGVKAYKTDAALFCALMGVLVQIAFLDALSNRCLWILLCWVAMLPIKRPEQGGNDYAKVAS